MADEGCSKTKISHPCWNNRPQKSDRKTIWNCNQDQQGKDNFCTRAYDLRLCNEKSAQYTNCLSKRLGVYRSTNWFTERTQDCRDWNRQRLVYNFSCKPCKTKGTCLHL